MAVNKRKEKNVTAIQITGIFLLRTKALLHNSAVTEIQIAVYFVAVIQRLILAKKS